MVVAGLAGLLLLAVGFVTVADRLAYHLSLEPFSLTEQRCDDVVPSGLADGPERHECLRAELAKGRASPWRPALPLFLGGLVAGSVALALVARLVGRETAPPLKESRSPPGSRGRQRLDDGSRSAGDHAGRSTITRSARAPASTVLACPVVRMAPPTMVATPASLRIRSANGTRNPGR